MVAQFTIEVFDLRVFVFQQGGINFEEQNVACVETGIDIAKILERSHQQACADEYKDGQRYLRDNQCASQMKPPDLSRAAWNRRSIFFERGRQIHARTAKRRRAAEA